MRPDLNMPYILENTYPVNCQVKDAGQVLVQFHGFGGGLVAYSSEPYLQLAASFTLI